MRPSAMPLKNALKTLALAGCAALGSAVPSARAAVPPAAVTDLRVSALVSTGLGASSMTVTLSWTAPGEEGATGDISSGFFTIRYSSTTPILTGGDFDGANFSLDIATSGVVPGSLRSVSIPYLSALATHYFVIKTTDSETLVSDLSVAATGQAYIRRAPSGVRQSRGGAWGDYDGDGDLDAIVANAGAENDYLLTNDGTGRFTVTDIADVAGSQAVAWADYDNDGDLDAFLANPNSDQTLLRNNGDGTFARVVLAGTNGPVKAAAWGDCNRDGRPDLVLALDSGGDEAVLINEGGSFSSHTIAGTGGDSLGAAWGDYDNDGDLDAVVGNDNTDAFILKNDGQCGFTKVNLAGTGNLIRGVAWADYNGDGNLDIAMARYGTTMRLLKGDGAGGFTILNFGGGSDNFTGVSWGDVDNDGDLDMVLSNDLNNGLVLRNDGGDSFTGIVLGGTSAASKGVSLGDMDGDGDLDVLFSVDQSSEIVLSNDLSSVHAAPSAPSSGFSASFSEYSVFSTSGVLTLQWGAGSDDKTPPAGLEYLVRVGTTAPGTSTAYRVPPRYSLDGSAGGGSFLYSTRPGAGVRGIKFVVQKETTAYWGVMAVDGEAARSAESAAQTTSLAAPAAVANLQALQDASVETSSEAWVNLSFTAPGDDGSAGDLGAGSVYDVRWSTSDPIDTDAEYVSAPNQLLLSAQGTAGGARTVPLQLRVGRTYHFCLTTKDGAGVRSPRSNSASLTPTVLREEVLETQPASVLQGDTTGFLRLRLWTDANTLSWTGLRLVKRGTLPDAAIDKVALYEDVSPYNGVLDPLDYPRQISQDAVFASSAVTLSFQPAATIGNSPKTYFVGLSFSPTYLPVDGATVAVSLDGEAFLVKGGGVAGIDFPGMNFNGDNNSAARGYGANMNVAAVTLEAWVKTSDTRADRAIVTRGDASLGGYRLWLGGSPCAAGVPTLYIAGSALCANLDGVPVVVNDGRWHHVAAGYAPTQGKIMFVDGVPLSTETATGSLGNTSSGLSVGGSSFTPVANSLNGQVDEVRISNFVRYSTATPFSPPRRLASDGSTVGLYHFDAVDGADLTAKDASTNGYDLALSGSATGYARTGPTALADAQDVLVSSGVDLSPAEYIRNAQNVPIMKLHLWSNRDFATLNRLSVEHIGSGSASGLTDVRLYLDDGNGLFDALQDSNLVSGAEFAGDKATFTLLAAGKAQTIGVSTKTYFITWTILPNAALGQTHGLRIATTSEFLLAGTTDAGDETPMPLATGLRSVSAALSMVVPETSTGVWVNVSSIVFQGNFTTGNVTRFRYIWDRSPATDVPDIAAGLAWDSNRLKTTTTATTDASDWYFHVRAFDSANNAGTIQHLGPFWVDRTLGSGSGFRSYNSTAGVLNEADFNDLIAGVTAQLTVQDAVSGLSLGGPAPLAPSGPSLWHLDETAGSAWADAGPSGNTLGVGAGTPVKAAGRFGAGLLFDGVSEARCAAPKGLPSGSAPRTIEAWVLPRSTAGTQGILAWWPGAGEGLRLGLVGGRLSADLGGGYVTQGPVLSTGVWHHAAFSYDGSAGDFYLDGETVGTGSFGARATASGVVVLGATDAGQRFHGIIDEVRIRDRALGPGEAADAFVRGDPYWVSYSTDAGTAWRVVSASGPWSQAYVSLTGAHGSLSAETLQARGLDLVTSTSTATGGSATNQVRFHFADAAGNVRTSGPFAILVDTSAPVAVSSPSLPGIGAYAQLRTSFSWTGPSTTTVAAIRGHYYLQVSNGDPAFAPGSVVISVSTPALVADSSLEKGIGTYISTFTLTEGATYYWRVRARSFLGVFGPWSQTASFVTDASSASVSAFRVFSSTGGTFLEGQAIDMLSGVSLQVTVRDLVAGLSRSEGLSPVAGTRGLWHFSETEGQNPVDAAGRNVPAQLACTGGVACSSPTYTLTPFGAGVRCQNNQGMTVPNTELNLAAGSPLTIEAWVRPDSVSGVGVIAGIGEPISGPANYIFRTLDTRLAFENGAGSVTSEFGALSAGVWQHVAVAAQGDKVFFYVNGMLNSIRTAPGGTTTSGPITPPFSVCSGIDDSGNWSATFLGTVDELRVLDFAATPSQIAADYAGTRAGRFAVEYSTRAGAAWTVVSATWAGAGFPYLGLGGDEGSTDPQTLTVNGLELAHSTSTLTGSRGTNLIRFSVPDRGASLEPSPMFSIVVDTMAAAAVSTPAYPLNGQYMGVQPNFAWSGPSTKTVSALGSSAVYRLEVDDDAGFLSPEVSISTPVVTFSTMAAHSQGVYVSTFTLAHNTTYYWRVRVRDFLGVYSAPLTVGSFVMDLSSPAASTFLTLNSTGGLVAEGTVNDLMTGVTAQITMTDAGPAGLSTAPFSGFESFGVLYTTQGASGSAASWTDGSWADALALSGHAAVTAMEVYGGRLYAGTEPSAGEPKVLSFDGSSWSQTPSLPAGTTVLALREFQGKLYAGLAGGGGIRVYDGGGSWDVSFAPPATRVNALREYRGRLYAATGEAGSQKGRVYAFDPGSGNWYLSWDSPAETLLSLEVYNGRLFAGGYPTIYVLDGSTWAATSVPDSGVTYSDLQTYNGKLYAASNFVNRVYAYDGASWSYVQAVGGGAWSRPLGTHAGRLYAGLDTGVPQVVTFDGRDWAATGWLKVHPLASGDAVACYKEYQGRLYAGVRPWAGGPGGALLHVSTPVAVSLTGADGTTSPQTFSAKSLSLAKSANANVCGGAAPCTATDQIRFTAMDRGGLVRAAGPFAILVDTLLGQPTAAYPASGDFVRFSSPTFAWVEISTMPKHHVQVSSQSALTPLSVDVTTTTQYMASPAGLTHGTTYYWRVRSLNSLNVPSAFSGVGSFIMDLLAPTATGFTHAGSSGGALGEIQISSLAAGGTVQMLVQDELPNSGLSPSAAGGAGRVAVWHFDEPDGPVAYDASGGLRSGGLAAGAARAEAVVGRGLSFDGTAGRHVDLAPTALGAWTGLTAAAWVKATQPNAANLTVWSSSRFRLQAHAQDGVLSYRVDGAAGGGCSVATSTSFPTNVWTHLAFVMDPGADLNKLYVDGELKASCAGSGTPADGAFRFGQDGLSGLGGNDPFNGQLDEARLFSRALSASELRAERDTPHAFALISTDAGAAWTAVGTAVPGAGPYLSFTGVLGSTGPETMRVENLSLAESTSAAVCAGVSPCGATNQVRFYVPDRAGNMKAAGPFAVLVDSSVPQPTLTSLTPLTSDTLYVTASGTDNLSGLEGLQFQFEASTSPAFTGVPVFSPFASAATHTFASLLTATTYHVRVRTRDALFNVSDPSLSFSTSTFGSILYSTTAATPASAFQNAAVPMLRFSLSTPAGTSKFHGMRVERTGDCGDAAVAEARIYKDNGDGVFSGADTPLGGAAFVSSISVINLPSPQNLSVSISTFFLVYQMAQDATVDATVGARVNDSADIFLPHPSRAEGTYPTTAGPILISDGPNTLSLVPQSLAPSESPPGTQNVPLLKLSGATDTGTSLIEALVLRLTGTLAPTQISGLSVWRDANANGSLDALDEVVSAGDDLFDGNGVSTVTLTAPPASRTVTQSGQRFFVTASLGIGATLGAGFQVRIASASAVLLDNPLDIPVFTAEPVISSTLTVLRNNLVTVSPTDLVPSVYYQGERYAVLKATLTVDTGFAEINRIRIDRSGTAQNADIEAVEVYRDQSADGGAFNIDVDVFLGSAAFSGLGQASVAITTQTLNAGTTYVLFAIYKVGAGANPGRTLGVSLANSGYVQTVNPLSAVTGPFPVQTSTATIQATVNRMLIPSAAPVAPGGLEQGAQDIPMIRFDAVSDKNEFSWLGLAMERLGTGADADVSALKIWRDNGDASFSAAADQNITGGADTFNGSGQASVPLSVAQTVSRSTRTYFVTISLSPSATPGGTLGVRISTTSAFNLSSPNQVSTATVFPIDGGPTPVSQFPNSISVATASVVPPLGAEPGLKNIGMMRLDLNTDVSNSQWTSLRLDQVGSAADSEVSAVKVYYDLNDSGFWDSSNLANYQLLTSTTQSFGGAGPGSVNLVFSTAPVLGPVTKRFFVTVDLATAAAPGRTVALRAINNSYFQVNAPNQVLSTSFLSGTLTVNAPPQKLYVLGTSSAPAQIVQGETNVPMLTLKVWMSRYTGQWSQLQVSRSGAGLDSDIPTIKLFRDADDNGILDVVTDERLSTAAFSGGSAVLSFSAQSMTVSTRTYFLTGDVALTAVTGDTVGLQLGAPGVFTVAAPHSADALGFPITSATSAVVATQTNLFVTSQNKAPGVLVQGATNQLMMGLSLNTTQHAMLWSGLTFRSTGTAADSDIQTIHVWRDANGNGALDAGVDIEITSGLNGFLSGSAVVSLVSIQTIGTNYERYLVSADVAPYAVPGRTFGLVLASTGAFTVSSPNSVATDNFPHSSALVPLSKQPELLLVAPASVASAGINQGTESAVARLEVRASRNRIRWTQIRLTRTGTLGDTDVSAVRVWKDMDGSGALGAADLLVGTGTFSAGQAALILSSAQTVGLSTQTYFVSLALNAAATIDATVGVTLQDASFFSVDVPDGISSAGLPFSTSLSAVLDSHTPSKPVVTVDAASSSNFEYLRFTWTSTVAVGGLAGAFYAIGTSAGAADVRAYTALAVTETDVRASGFALLNGTTYYVSVKTQSDSGFWSPVGTSIGVLMDFTVPPKPAPAYSPGDTTVLVTWASVPGGPSGLMGYLIEYRTGSSPLWYNAKTRLRSSALRSVKANGAELSVAALTAADVVTGNSYQVTGLPQGTVFLRMRAVSSSGVASESSETSRVQLGALPKDLISAAGCYPNPFDSRKEGATLTYTASASADVGIKIFSVFGREVKTMSFPAGSQGGMAGSNEVRWDGSDDSGRKVSKGMYIAVIESGGSKAVLKIGVIH